jgi:hypothetical protein
MVAVQTVAENRVRFTKRENDRADEVKDVLAAGLGLPSDRNMISMLDGGRILNCPLTGADVLNKADIHGKTLANLKGKRTKQKSEPMSSAVLPVIPPSQREQVLSADVMFIYGMSFLLGRATPLGLRMVSKLKAKSQACILAAIKSQIDTLNSRNFTVQRVLMDGESAVVTRNASIPGVVLEANAGEDCKVS